MQKEYLPFLLLALGTLATACTVNVEPDPGAQIGCESAGDCPDGTQCNTELGRCISLELTEQDQEPPDVSGAVTLRPTAGRVGTTFTMVFMVTETLVTDPRVEVETADGQWRPFAHDREVGQPEAGIYAFIFTASGEESEGERSTRIILVDAAANDRTIDGPKLQFDFTPPSEISLELAGFDGQALNTQTVTFALSALDTVSTELEFYLDGDLEDGETVRVWAALEEAVSASLTTGDGTKEVQVQVRDGVGNSASATEDFTLDTAPPQDPSAVIQEKPVTGAQGIHLDLQAAGASEVKVTGDVVDDASTMDWIALTTPLEVSLTAGDGPKTVSALFRDEAQNEAGPVSDTIELQTGAVSSTPTLTLPAGQSAVKNGDLLVVGGQGEAGAEVVSARLVKTTDGSDAQVLPSGTVNITAAGALSGTIDASGLVDGATVAVEVILSVRGQVSVPENARSQPVSVDLTPPSDAQVIVDEGGAVASTTVHLSISALGATQMYLDGSLQDASGVREWGLMQSSATVLVTSGDGSKAINVRFRDNAHNEASKAAMACMNRMQCPRVLMN